MRGSFAGEGRRRGKSLGLLGGVVKRVDLETLRLFSEGELPGVSMLYRNLCETLTIAG